MAKIVKSAFRLDQFIIQDFSIKRKPHPQDKVDLSINPGGLHLKYKNEFHLTLEVEIRDTNESYTIQLRALGIFKLKPDEGDDRLSNYFYTNAPAIIFPYVRSYISAITALTGLNTVNLPVMNLSGLRETLKKQTKEIESAPDVN